MPQMAPLWWSVLFIMFIAVFIITGMLIYSYLKMVKINLTLEIFKPTNNWKW